MIPLAIDLFKKTKVLDFGASVCYIWAESDDWHSAHSIVIRLVTDMMTGGSRAFGIIAFILTPLILAITVCLAASAEQAPRIPTVVITSPENGAVLSGSKAPVSVTFRATERHPVSAVKVFLDGKFISQKTYEKPVIEGTASFIWDISRSPKGAHRLDVQIFSDQLYLGMATCVVTIADGAAKSDGRDIEPPQVRLLGLNEGQIVSGTVRIGIEASDNSGKPPYVTIAIDGQVKSIRNFPPYVYEWNTLQEDNGPHVIKVSAMDDAENRRDTKPVRVIVRNAVTSMPIVSVPENVVSNLGQLESGDRGDNPAPANRRPSTITRSAQGREGNSTEPVVKVSSTLEEYRRTLFSPAEVDAEGFDIRVTSTPVAAVPGAINETKGTEESVAQKAPTPAVVESQNPKEGREDTQPSSPEGVPSVKDSRDEVRDAAKPLGSVSSPGAGPVIAARTGSPDMPGPRFKGDLRLAAPASAGCLQVSIIEKQPAEYIVKPGDSISAIAKRFKVSASDLIRLNKIKDPDLIKVGDKLLLP